MLKHYPARALSMGLTLCIAALMMAGCPNKGPKGTSAQGELCEGLQRFEDSWNSADNEAAKKLVWKEARAWEVPLLKRVGVKDWKGELDSVDRLGLTSGTSTARATIELADCSIDVSFVHNHNCLLTHEIGTDKVTPTDNPELCNRLAPPFIDRPAVVSTLIGIDEGDCVIFSGDVYPLEQSVTQDGAMEEPEYRIGLTSLRPCERNDSSDEIVRGGAGSHELWATTLRYYWTRFDDGNAGQRTLVSQLAGKFRKDFWTGAQPRFSGWRGRVIDVSGSGDNVTFELDMGYKNDFHMTFRNIKRISTNDPVFQALGATAKEACVAVSGTIDPTEKSVTERGGLRAPEFNVNIESAKANVPCP